MIIVENKIIVTIVENKPRDEHLARSLIRIRLSSLVKQFSKISRLTSIGAAIDNERSDFRGIILNRK